MQRKALPHQSSDDALPRYQPTVGSAALYDSRDRELHLRDIYCGYQAFLLCGGPSLAAMNLDRLSQRGILTMGVNNSPAVYRPHLWTHIDAPGRFIPQLWLDATVWKFSQYWHHDHRIRIRNEEGGIVDSQLEVQQCPATFYYHGDEQFDALSFLRSPTFSVGLPGAGGCRSVMLVALKLLYVLGVRTAYLLGCDFRMQQGAANYAFPQERPPSTVDSNNRSYGVLNERFTALRPHFEDHGLHVYNCTPESGLKSFEAMEFGDAVSRAAAVCGEPVNTYGHYDR